MQFDSGFPHKPGNKILEGEPASLAIDQKWEAAAKHIHSVFPEQPLISRSVPEPSQFPNREMTKRQSLAKGRRILPCSKSKIQSTLSTL